MIHSYSYFNDLESNLNSYDSQNDNVIWDDFSNVK